MDNFSFPSNIKQIGSIEDGLKIYVEDYVYSYLNQYSESDDYVEKIAVLMGKHLEIDGQEVLFVSGAIQGKHSVVENGISTFTDETWDYIKEQKKLFFNDLDVIGWMHSQPSYGIFINSNYANYYMSYFKEPYNVMYVWDPIERVNAFYIYNEDQTDIIEIPGYFIYYEKNTNMHNYMLENPIVKSSFKSSGSEIMLPSEDFNNTYDSKNVKSPKKWFENQIEEDIENKDIQKNTQKNFVEQKRLVNLLVGLSAVLFVVSFIMGVGLVQNEDRITVLEQSLDDLNSAYKTLVTNSKEATVFASQQKEGTDYNNASITNVDGNEILSKTQNDTNTIDVNDEKNNIAEIENKPSEPESISTQEENSVMKILRERDEKKEEEKNISATSTEETEQANETNNETAKSIPEFYVVKKGDSLLLISRKFYGTDKMTKKIMEANNMTDPNKIKVDQKLILPKP